MASVTHIGVLASEPVNGAPVDLSNDALAVSTASNDLSIDTGLSNDALAVSTASNDIILEIVLSNDANAVSTASNDIYAEFQNLSTAKLSDYTIFENLQKYSEYANDNLITQFVDCPNILKLLDTPLLELDKVKQDILDFQELILNLELATGDRLDLLGLILGQDRLIGQGDLQYRNILFSQIQKITCDGCLNKMLAAILMKYNYPIDHTSRNKVAIRTLTHNVVQIYIKNYLDVLNNGGPTYITDLVAAGGEAIILVNDSDTELGNFFTLENTIKEVYDYQVYDWPIANGDFLPDTVGGFLDSAGPITDFGVEPLIDITAQTTVTPDEAYHFFGTFRILTEGDYTFKLQSNEGSLLFIDDDLVVDNNGGAGDTLQTSETTVQSMGKGVYRIDVTYFERTGDKQLTLTYSGPDTGNIEAPLEPYTIATVSGSGFGAGLGSLDSAGGGELTAQYNQDPNGTILYPFGLEGSVGTLGLNEGQFISSVVTFNHAHPIIEDGPDTPTTTSLIPIPTFG